MNLPSEFQVNYPYLEIKIIPPILFQLPSRVIVMRDDHSDANSVGEKLCKHKYSSYPYCYDEIATDTTGKQRKRNLSLKITPLFLTKCMLLTKLLLSQVQYNNRYLVLLKKTDTHPSL